MRQTVQLRPTPGKARTSPSLITSPRQSRSAKAFEQIADGSYRRAVSGPRAWDVLDLEVRSGELPHAAGVDPQAGTEPPVVAGDDADEVADREAGAVDEPADPLLEVTTSGWRTSRARRARPAQLWPTRRRRCLVGSRVSAGSGRSRRTTVPRATARTSSAFWPNASSISDPRPGRVKNPANHSGSAARS